MTSEGEGGIKAPPPQNLALHGTRSSRSWYENEHGNDEIVKIAVVHVKAGDVYLMLLKATTERIAIISATR